MIQVEVRCTTCKIPMECIANIKIVGNGNIAHLLTITNIGGIYECPKCKKRIDLQIRQR
jgi:hypothetical protein